ncbi:Rhomboid-related protein 1 [Pseudolycoriella hygida]|uniref:Rhomboid-related protein 1 n=1 Tax=Pseudolycoriella hygida TaxID=35572 RepID=A0A9Q0S4P5_9DIPT|nr:Rhomboid-related protein 1 [Pseudolycoriella hygida]
MTDPEALTISTQTLVKESFHTHPRYFPFFMIGISFVQGCLTILVSGTLLALLFSYDPQRRHELWRYLTVMLVHAGPRHLLPNVAFQIMLGVILEIEHNSKRIAIVYLASVLGGSLFNTVLTPKKYAVGASAAVYGLFFSHLATILLNWNVVDKKWFRIMLLTLFISFDIASSLYYEIFLNVNLHVRPITESNRSQSASRSVVSYAGHLGGALTGFLVSFLALKKFEDNRWQETLQIVCIGLLSAGFIFILLFNICTPNLYLPTEWNFEYSESLKNYSRKFLKGEVLIRM